MPFGRAGLAGPVSERVPRVGRADDEGPAPDAGVNVHNWNREADHGFSLPPRLVVWDETLRDGEQTPGVSFTRAEKVELAKLLDEAGVAVLNCGIPAVSDEELRSVKAIAQEGLARASVLATGRTLRSDIDACLRTGADEISLFIACSDLHLKHKLRMTRQEALARATTAVEYAVDHGLPVTFVTEDTVRADLGFVVEMYRAAAEVGATRFLFCDTVGVMTPSSVRWFFAELRRRGVPEGPQWGFHNHNDFGMATANALAAFEAGVPCLNTTVNGIGERAGNTALEEVVMALERLYGYPTGIRTQLLTRLSHRVEELSGIAMQPTKPVVGANAFTHESGIHTHGVIAHSLTYEPMQPEDVGQARRFVFGKHTGTAAVSYKLEKAGVTASEEEIRGITEAIKRRAESKDKAALREAVLLQRRRLRDGTGVTEDEFWGLVGSRFAVGAEVRD